jgi:hypothetical protein
LEDDDIPTDAQTTLAFQRNKEFQVLVPSQRPLWLSDGEIEQLDGEREINSGFPFVATLVIDGQGCADEGFEGLAAGCPHQGCQ